VRITAGWSLRHHPDQAARAEHADRIYVLRDGQVIEQGVHADLLALGGQYAELFTLQAAQYNL
jgi:ATP-binding cassette subfamily B protein